MGRKHYELGVSLYRRRFLALPSLRQTGVLVLLIAVLGLGYHGSIPGLAGLAHLRKSDGAEKAYRQNRSNKYKDTKRYTSSGSQVARSASQLRVLPAASVVPSAAPSTPVAAVPAPVDVVPASPVTPVIADAADQPAPDSVINRTQVLDQPDPTPVAGIPVITAPEPGVTVSVVVPSLPVISVPTGTVTGLDDPVKKDLAMQLVSSAENSSTDWKSQYAYIEDIHDGRGYTAGIIGFCSGTGDMLDLIQYYTKLNGSNVLATYIPALQKLNGSSSHTGLDPNFVNDWKTAAKDPLFQQAQNDERDRVYFNPAVSQAKSDGLHALGQFIYYDAMVMHGPGSDSSSFGGIRAAALKKAQTPAQGGDETTYLNAFLDARVAAMKMEAAHDDVSRVETAQRVFLKAGNLDLVGPLTWKVYGETFTSQ